MFNTHLGLENVHITHKAVLDVNYLILATQREFINLCNICTVKENKPKHNAVVQRTEEVEHYVGVTSTSCFKILSLAEVQHTHRGYFDFLHPHVCINVIAPSNANILNILTIYCLL